MGTSRKFIYRYQGRQEYIFDIIKNKHLYFAHYSELNDPHDCKFPFSLTYGKYDENIWQEFMYVLSKYGGRFHSEDDINKDAEAAIKKGLHHDTSWIKDVEKYVNNQDPLVRICCFTKSPMNMMMWAHYANNHKGVVLKFQRSFMADHNSGIDKFLDVAYYKSPLTVIDYIASVKDMDAGDAGSWCRKVYARKTNHWKSEKEVRCFARAEKCYVQFDEPALSGIIFGHACPDSFKRKVKCALDTWKIKPTVFHASIDYASTKLRIQKCK